MEFATGKERCRFMRRKDLDQSLIRQYITEALLQLMKTKDYKTISVGEIAERAGVHRATFYRHFSSKEDVLRACLAGIIQQSEGDRSLLRKDFVSFIQPVFQALYDKKEEILLLNRADLGSILLDVLKDYFGFDNGGTDAGEVKNQYHNAYRIGGIYACLLLWFSHAMKETPQQMAEIAASM